MGTSPLSWSTPNKAIDQYVMWCDIEGHWRYTLHGNERVRIKNPNSTYTTGYIREVCYINSTSSATFESDVGDRHIIDIGNQQLLQVAYAPEVIPSPEDDGNKDAFQHVRITPVRKGRVFDHRLFESKPYGFDSNSQK